MANKIVRLTEKDMSRLIKKILMEDEENPTPGTSGYEDTIESLKKFLVDKMPKYGASAKVYPKKMGYYTVEIRGRRERAKFENGTFNLITRNTVERQVDEHAEIISRSLERRGIDRKSTDRLRYKLNNWASDPQPCTEKEWNDLSRDPNAKGVIPTYAEIMAYYWFLS